MSGTIDIVLDIRRFLADNVQCPAVISFFLFFFFFSSVVAPNKAEKATDTLGATKQKRKGRKVRKRENK